MQTEIKQTKAQRVAIKQISDTLDRCWSLPSEYVGMEVESKDPFTHAILVRLNFVESHGYIYVGTAGGIRERDGGSLKACGRFAKLPALKPNHRPVIRFVN